MKLLDLMPEVARFTQSRFSENFIYILIEDEMEQDIDKAMFIVHQEKIGSNGRPYVTFDITYELKEVISIVSELGKDCQVIKIEPNGMVESLS